MERCAEVWLGKEHTLYSFLFRLLDFLPLIIGVAAGLISFWAVKKAVIGEKSVRINGKITEITNNNQQTDENTAPNNFGITVFYQYEYNCQVFNHQKTYPFLHELTVGSNYPVTISASNPDKEIPTEKLSAATTVALMAAIVIGALTLRVIESIGTGICR